MVLWQKFSPAGSFGTFRIPTPEFCKKALHPSGRMAILSLPCGYKLKDILGIFQPRFISFGAERKIVRLRLKNHSAENFLPLSAMKES